MPIWTDLKSKCLCVHTGTGDVIRCVVGKFRTSKEGLRFAVPSLIQFSPNPNNDPVGTKYPELTGLRRVPFENNPVVQIIFEDSAAVEAVLHDLVTIHSSLKLVEEAENADPKHAFLDNVLLTGTKSKPGREVRMTNADWIKYCYEAEVLHVVDGDTVELVVSLGFGNIHTDRFRLFGPDPDGKEGLNAPELNTPEGKAARDFLVGLLSAPGPVRIRTIRDRREKYGRILAVIWVFSKDAQNPAQGIWVNANQSLVENGHAILRQYDPTVVEL